MLSTSVPPTTTLAFAGSFPATRKTANIADIEWALLYFPAYPGAAPGTKISAPVVVMYIPRIGDVDPGAVA
jgi:hypothetical protein